MAQKNNPVNSKRKNNFMIRKNLMVSLVNTIRSLAGCIEKQKMSPRFLKGKIVLASTITKRVEKTNRKNPQNILI
jgi:hypothetical protein